MVLDRRSVVNPSRLVLVVVSAILVGCTSSAGHSGATVSTTVTRTELGPTTAAGPPVTLPSATHAPVDDRPPAVDQLLEEWQRKIDGKTLTYEAEFSCGVCTIGGKWRVSERNGAVIDATYLTEHSIETGLQPITLTAALAAARAATGVVSIANSTPAALHFIYDSNPTATDDEVDYTATDIVINDTLPSLLDPQRKAVDQVLAEWQRTTEGKTLTYIAVFSCRTCAAAGKWRVSERDGAIIDATYLTDHTIEPSLPPLTLTAALAAARAATGVVSIVNSTPAALQVIYDSKPNATGDEVDYTATDIVTN